MNQKKAPLNNNLGPLYESKKFSGRPSESILRENTRAAAAKPVSKPRILYCLIILKKILIYVKTNNRLL